ncbi:MAG: hypothetical protein QME71_04105 [Dehalococcoidia bacterium]|nr:hypothetical protein [Dehalococcoidia bacterium]
MTARALEKLALGLVMLVIAGLPAATVGYQRYIGGDSGNGFTLVAGESAWTPETLRVRQGELVRLRLTSNDVVHGFLLEDHDVAVDAVYPGEFTSVEFVADKAGRFGFVCTRVCGEGHHRMWGELIVEAEG